MRKALLTLIALPALCLSCMKWEDSPQGDSVSVPPHALFITCEGMFQYGNASLSIYDPERKTVENNVFYRANDMRLGDVAHSASIYDGRLWLVVNNSHLIFAIDDNNCREQGRIRNLTSPRYIHFLSPSKAYVTQLWDTRIAIVDPSSYTVTGHIEVPDMGPAARASTEQMISVGGYVFVNCWSYQHRILKIDPSEDKVLASVDVGLQPCSMAADALGRLWILCDGGAYPENPAGYEEPSLWTLEPGNMTATCVMRFPLGTDVSGLCADGTGRNLYWLEAPGRVWTMDVSNTPGAPGLLVDGGENKLFYSMTVDPRSGEIYVADAIDYQQPGIVYRYSADGTELIDSFYAGVTPGSFVWK